MPTLWELINPSDPYSFLTGSHEVAALVTVALGSGQYGANEVGGEERAVPLFIFGGGEEWYEREFGRTPEAGLAALSNEVASAMGTVLIGSPESRQRMESVWGAITNSTDRAAAKAAYHDAERSSMNDIGARAARWAASLGGAAEAKPLPAPRQVFGT